MYVGEKTFYNLMCGSVYSKHFSCKPGNVLFVLVWGIISRDGKGQEEKETNISSSTLTADALADRT